jgi:hypothetical protein
MVAYVFPSWWRKYRQKPDHAGIVNSPNIPFKLDINGHWMGQMLYNDRLSTARSKGDLYVGVIASHSDRTHLIRVPRPKKDTAPKEQIARGA